MWLQMLLMKQEILNLFFTMIILLMELQRKLYKEWHPLLDKIVFRMII